MTGPGPKRFDESFVIKISLQEALTFITSGCNITDPKDAEKFFHGRFRGADAMTHDPAADREAANRIIDTYLGGSLIFVSSRVEQLILSKLLMVNGFRADRLWDLATTQNRYTVITNFDVMTRDDV